MYRVVVVTVPARQEVFAHAFAERGCRWAFADDAAGAADEVLSAPTDALVVDLAFLDAGGLTVASSLRRIKGMESLPVVAVIRADSAAHMTGAQGIFAQRAAPWDEFVLDPLRDGELTLRVEMLLARRRGGGFAQLGVGEVVIDFERYEVTRDGRRVDLTYKEHELLRFLASNPDKPFTREALLDRVWGGDYLGGVRTVDVHVRRLRAKLGDLRGQIIETVRGVGYRFTKPGR